MDIIKLTKGDFKNVEELFGQQPFGWDIFIETALDYGFILADDQQNPHVALAFVGGCILYGGDPTHEAAIDLIKAQEVQPCVLAYPKSWADFVKEVYGEQVKCLTRYYFPFASFKKEKLYHALLEEPREYRIQKMSMKWIKGLEALGEVYHKYHYKDLQDFLDRGCCFCVTKGEEVCAAVGAYLRSDNKIQVQVNTKKEYLNQGLATIACAHMLRYCLDNQIQVGWDASNLISKKLANKLGYEECVPYLVLEYFPN